MNYEHILGTTAILGAFVFFGHSESEARPDRDIGSPTRSAQFQTVDARALTDLADNLENTCAEDGLGSAAGECMALIDRHKEPCAERTAELYPEPLSSPEGMNGATALYVDCLFDERQVAR